ncbi:hypothetical protein BVRB_8g193930 [Beta vulgaris subsp. vulgaris]|nr:hypothetical protein BVRB_8g193930 [Beta vulgaris subsp. vulgaris]
MYNDSPPAESNPIPEVDVNNFCFLIEFFEAMAKRWMLSRTFSDLKEVRSISEPITVAGWVSC